jgi:beta-lactamase regulating signal transducer with metallopeptidase domain
VDVIANWVLQGSALAAATAVVLRALPRLSATTRYRVWWVALAAVLALPLLHRMPTRPITPPESAVTAAAQYNVAMPLLPEWAIVMAGAMYVVWTAISLGRIGRALLDLRAAKRRCRKLPPGRQKRLPCWSALRDHGRRAELVVSDDVRSASVLGLTSPLIAVSPALLGALDDDELDSILVHEWAHVHRRDDFTRLLQAVVRAIAGLHPGIWWIDRQLHLDRETACDDWAINLTGSVKRYAACLTKLATLSLASRDATLQPAALSPTDLTTRVTRLLDQQRSTSTRRPVAATAVAFSLLTGLAIIVAGVQLVVPTTPVRMLAARPDAVAPGTLSLPRVAPDDDGVTDPEAAPHVDVARAENIGRSAPRPRVNPVLAPAAITQAVAAADAAEPAAPASTAGAPEPIPLQKLEEIPFDTQPPDVAVAGASGEGGQEPVAAAPPAKKPETPWGLAAEAGVNLGRESQDAAVAAAGLFSRLGRSLAGRF